jgi:hypothetical protein
MVGVIGPIGSGLPQFGFPRRLAMKIAPRARDENTLQGFPAKLDSFVFAKDSALSRLPQHKPCCGVARFPDSWKLVILMVFLPAVNDISGCLASSPIHVEENKALVAFARSDLGFPNALGFAVKSTRLSYRRNLNTLAMH